VVAVADTLAAALWLADRGMHVFDVDHPELTRCAGIRTAAHDPATCTDRGKHPCGKWSELATTDRERVTAMFAGTTRNIGVASVPPGCWSSTRTHPTHSRSTRPASESRCRRRSP
jgi:hypothetical protein